MTPTLSTVTRVAAAGLLLAAGVAGVRSASDPASLESGPIPAGRVPDPSLARAGESAGAARRPSRSARGRTVSSTRGGLRTTLAEADLGPQVLANLTDLVRPYADPEALPPGTPVTIFDGPAGTPTRISFPLDADRTARLSVRGASWTLAVDTAAATLDTVTVIGVVRSGLFATDLYGEADRLSAVEVGHLVGELSDVFAWQVDFFHEIRSGDAFRVTLERELRPDGSVRAGHTIAAELWTAGRRLTAYRFSDTDRRSGPYYDEQGRPLRGDFLRAPLSMVRVTSGFEPARYHPLLGGARPHQGVDYGAPSGTPVRATADGVVTRAGWWGGYGLAVEIRHRDGLRTRYAHLSALSPGIAAGASVEQGERIGRVGSTGLATGTHLHYELLHRGRSTDPAAVVQERGTPLEGESLAAFLARRNRARARLERTPWPEAERPALGPATRPHSSSNDLTRRSRKSEPGAK